MSLKLTTPEITALWAEAEKHCPPATSIDRLETIYTVPPQLGSGHHRSMELLPGLELSIIHRTCRELTQQVPENEHLVQFAAYLSGVFDSGDFVRIDAEQSYVGGSGVQPSHSVAHAPHQPQIGVDIHLQPHLFSQLFATPLGNLPSELQPLVRGDDWQQRFSPKLTEAMRLVVQQIMNCPFLGATKRLYLQGKVFELMALQLDGLLHSSISAHSSALKPDTVDCIHQAAEILRSHLENPPSQAELAQQVGVCDRTLHKGFKAIFGVTPFAYLSQQRMNQAEQLLRQPNRTVAEVANIVGYANPAQFAAAFKRHFGITPSACLGGKKIARNSLLG